MISPLCCASTGTPSVVKAANRGNSSTVWRSTATTEPKETEKEDTTGNTSGDAGSTTSNSSSGSSSSDGSNRLSLNLSGPGELLPRIAEEKDSPTNSQEAKSSK